MRFDWRRPPGAPANGNAATAHSSPDAGYLAVDYKGRLKRRVVYYYYEKARKIAGASGRVISRPWWERKQGKEILES